MMEGKTADNADGYFPVLLWVWVYGHYQEKTPIIRIAGLRDFGLPELGYYDPMKFDVKELLDFLYAMSCLQIMDR